MKTKLFSTLFVFVAAVAFLFSSCNAKQNIPQADLDGYWVLKTLNGKDAKNLFKGALPTLEFHFGDSATISGTGGCNRYSGPFTYEKGIFNAPQLAVTTMLCTEDNQEPEFILALSNKDNGLSLDNGILKFTFSGVVTLEFEKGTPAAEEQPVTPSEQTVQGEWVLNTIDGVDAKARFNSIPTISFNFLDKKVSGNDGCNRYSASFSLEGHNLVLSPVMSTRMACDGMEGIAQFNQAIADSSIITLPSEKVLQIAKNGAILLEFNKLEAVSDTTKSIK